MRDGFRERDLLLKARSPPDNNDHRHVFRPGLNTYIIFDCQLQNLLKGVDRILSSYRIPFIVPNMIVGCEHDLNGVFGF